MFITGRHGAGSLGRGRVGVKNVGTATSIGQGPGITLGHQPWEKLACRAVALGFYIGSALFVICCFAFLFVGFGFVVVLKACSNQANSRWFVLFIFLTMEVLQRFVNLSTPCCPNLKTANILRSL